MRGLVIFALLALCASCTRTVYEPVETVRTEYVKADTTGLYESLRSLLDFMSRREASSDSLIDRTKETVVLKENGDTARHDRERMVYVASHREKELEHTVRQQDSTIKSLRLLLESVKSDSIRIPYPVERKLTKWEQTKQDVGGIALGAVGAVVCAAVVWLIRKFRR